MLFYKWYFAVLKLNQEVSLFAHAQVLLIAEAT